MILKLAPLFRNPTVDNAVEALRRLWQESIAIGPAENFDMDEIKRKSRAMLDRNEIPPIPEAAYLQPISLIEVWFDKAEESIAEADKLLNKMDETIRLLSLQPEMGRKQPEVAEGVFVYPIRGYLLFYKEQPGGGIELIRLTYGVPDSDASTLGLTLRQMLY